MLPIEEDRFEELVVEALDGLPDRLGRLMRNVAVTVEHEPGPPGLLGLYRGVPLTERTSHYSATLPDHITIYRVAMTVNEAGAGYLDSHSGTQKVRRR